MTSRKLSSPTLESFWPSQVQIPARLRQINADKVDELAASISDIGLRHPVTVRWGVDEDGDQVPILVAGHHRLAACDKLGILVNCAIFDGTETDARLWEIAENLHRAELTVQERAEHIAEWIRLTDAVAQVEPRSKDGKFSEGGVRAASRELGIDRSEAQRAVKIAAITPEAKQEAVAAGIDNNQAALLRVAKESSPEAQLAAIKREREAADARATRRGTSCPLSRPESIPAQPVQHSYPFLMSSYLVPDEDDVNPVEDIPRYVAQRVFDIYGVAELWAVEDDPNFAPFVKLLGGKQYLEAVVAWQETNRGKRKLSPAPELPKF